MTQFGTSWTRLVSTIFFHKFVHMIEEMNIPLVGIDSVGSGGEPLKILFSRIA